MGNLSVQAICPQLSEMLLIVLFPSSHSVEYVVKIIKSESTVDLWAAVDSCIDGVL